MVGRKLSTGSLSSFCLPPFYTSTIVNKLLGDKMILVYVLDCYGMLPLNIIYYIHNHNNTTDEIQKGYNNVVN